MTIYGIISFEVELMKESLNNLNDWLNDLTSFSLPKWRGLPDLDLYMDQVVTYLERELSPITVEEQEKMITTWMINNYVKGNLLSNPVRKKYSREHLAYLLAICSIKQILSISDIQKLFDYQKAGPREPAVVYEFFRTTQSEMIKSIAKETIEKVIPLLNQEENINNEQANCFLYTLVFKLAIEAEVKKIIANKILSLVSKSKKEDIERKEKQEESAPEKSKKKVK
jgi:hypothetical protein